MSTKLNLVVAERGITAQALKKDYPHHLDKIIAAGIRADLFTSDYARKIFTAHASGVNLHDEVQLAKEGLLSGDYFELVADNPAVSGNFSQNLEAVASAQFQRLRQEIAERYVTGSDPKAISDEILSLDRLKPQDSAWIEKLETRRLKAKFPPTEAVTRFFLANKPIATPGNLVTMIAKSKTGKTAASGAMIASTVAAALGHTNADTLRFTASNPQGKALVLFDTEQSLYDAHLCFMRALRRANTDQDLEWLHPYGLAGWSPSELREALRSAMDNVKKSNGGVFAVVLDGVADFVFDPNDLKECNAFVAELHTLAIRYECPIICIIHSNEGKMAGDDGRGHLGKQLTRKSESNLLLKKVGDVTTITSEKQRKAPITEADGVAFKWSEEEGRHVSCDAPGTAKEIYKKIEMSDLANEVFGAERILRRTEIERRIADARNLKGNTPGRRVDTMKALGIIKNSGYGQYERVA